MRPLIDEIAYSLFPNYAQISRILQVVFFKNSQCHAERSEESAVAHARILVTLVIRLCKRERHQDLSRIKKGIYAGIPGKIESIATP